MHGLMREGWREPVLYSTRLHPKLDVLLSIDNGPNCGLKPGRETLDFYYRGE